MAFISKFTLATIHFLSTRPSIGMAAAFFPKALDWLSTGQGTVKLIGIYIGFGIALLTLGIKAFDFARRVERWRLRRQSEKQTQ
jgi:hypothetical protein